MSSLLSAVGVFLVITATVNANRILSVTKFQSGTCSKEGIICINCKTAAQCIFVNNAWQPVPFEDCDADAGFFCNVNEGGCSQRVGACNPAGQEGNFVCNTMGVFPDPFDCEKYHFCYQNGQNLVSINMVCENTAFSPASGDCSLPLNDMVCTTPQWNCTQAGEMNAWPGNSNIYYLCIADTRNGIRVLYPELFRCSANQVFSEGRCVDRQTVPSLPGEDNSYRCDSPGLFPDVTNCRHYYFCDGNLSSQHLQCPVGSYFQPQTSSCVAGTC
ncbi:uncharacterized protein LOC135704412 [Ochlerotatus camptorhynchus]|uniref:uncharacterized protein LOC135704412 n=1 Tax=Ochlerotatus camptorhynchus TaxID=644619 RepID=UPI0031E0443C